MTTISPSKAKTLARRLLREKRKLNLSTRQFAKHKFKDKINFATLNRFMISQGYWTPKDEELLTVLGLIKPRVPRKGKTIKQMSRNELIDYMSRYVARFNQHLAERGIKLIIKWEKTS
jgi:hypothetical protein